MTYPIGFSNGRYNGSSEFDAYPGFGRHRVVLVAIHGDMFPPIFNERSALQRTRVVAIPPDANEFDLSHQLPGMFRRALPPMPASPPVSQPNRPQPRPVLGEILRDQEGRMYEKVGGEIRPLHRLVSGPNGQVFEMTPAAAREPIPGPAEVVEEAQDQEQGDLYRPEQSRDSRPAGPVAEPQAASAKPAPCRKLFPDPGPRRVVRLGDFKSMLAPQLAHPERLRDAHRLACYLQVYEVTAAQRLESLAASLLGDPAPVSQLKPLTERVARQFGLMALPPSRPRVPGNFPRQGGLLSPYERVFRLQLAQDPTADDVSGAGQQPAQNLQTKEPPPPAPGQSFTPTAERVKKTTIPERFVKPWEFKLTRDEALYDMNVMATFTGWFGALRRRLKGRIGARREWKKWRTLLYGKTAEEQLWGIRPPQGELNHPKIREWATKTLVLAGYDPNTMLLEWEIFWKRKGA